MLKPDVNAVEPSLVLWPYGDRRSLCVLELSAEGAGTIGAPGAAGCLRVAVTAGLP